MRAGCDCVVLLAELVERCDAGLQFGRRCPCSEAMPLLSGNVLRCDAGLRFGGRCPCSEAMPLLSGILCCDDGVYGWRALRAPGGFRFHHDLYELRDDA